MFWVDGLFSKVVVRFQESLEVLRMNKFLADLRYFLSASETQSAPPSRISILTSESSCQQPPTKSSCSAAHSVSDEPRNLNLMASDQSELPVSFISREEAGCIYKDGVFYFYISSFPYVQHLLGPGLQWLCAVDRSCLPEFQIPYLHTIHHTFKAKF